LAISSLGAGGAERVMTTMANYWATGGWDVTLATLTGADAAPFYPLDRRVRLRPLGLARPSRGALHGALQNLWRVGVLRGAVRRARPDVVLSFTPRTNVLVLLAAFGLRVPVVVSERVDPRHHAAPNRVWDRLRRLLYARAAAVVMQTAGLRDYFGPRARTRVVPNPVSAPAAAGPPAREPVVVGMGRLDPQKGFDLLLEAFARVAPRHPDWSLEVWGEGQERPRLQALADELGPAGRVRLPGVTRRPEELLRRAGVFVLSSRYEGFPNVLCEAMACGAPVLAADCPSGPADIVQDGVDGLLVPAGDAAALAAGLDRLLADPGLRGRLGAESPDVLRRFSLDRVMAAWEEVLREATGPPRQAVRPRRTAR
jgi:glycosyltransferase involved in cell wall biosynthesis